MTTTGPGLICSECRAAIARLWNGAPLCDRCAEGARRVAVILGVLPDDAAPLTGVALLNLADRLTRDEPWPGSSVGEEIDRQVRDWRLFAVLLGVPEVRDVTLEASVARHRLASALAGSLLEQRGLVRATHQSRRAPHNRAAEEALADLRRRLEALPDGWLLRLTDAARPGSVAWAESEAMAASRRVAPLDQRRARPGDAGGRDDR